MAPAKANRLQGTLDTIYGKVILFELGGQKSALITVDMCTVPLCVAEETLKKAGIEGLTLERLLICRQPHPRRS